MKKHFHIFTFSIVIVLLCAIGGCTAGGVQRQNSEELATANVSIDKPNHIYIGEINVNTGTWTPESDKPAFHAKVLNTLEMALPEKLADIAPTSKATGGETSGLLITATTTEVDVNNIQGRAEWGAQTYPPKLIVRIKVYDLAKSSTTPVTVFPVQGNFWEYKPLVAGGTFHNDYLDVMSVSIAKLTRDELKRLVK